MASLPLTMATGKHERARPLAEGRVPVDGIDLTTLLFKDNGARHDRFMAGEFDACEISFANYLRSWSQGMPFTAIPVFFNRQFRHSSIYINANAGIREPRDLNGKRIGILSWFNTAALWARGALQHEYGLDLTTVRWASGDAKDAGEPTLPAGVRITAVDGKNLVPLLLAGELDALITPRTPSRDHAPTIVRLFPDYRSVEEAYYRKTGVYPTSHALVVRKALLEEHPWIAERLVAASVEALTLAAEYADDPEHSTLAWYGAQSEYETAVFGPGGVTHGIEPNRKTLEMLVTYGHTAGLLPRRPAIEELFYAGAEHSVTRARVLAGIGGTGLFLSTPGAAIAQTSVTLRVAITPVNYDAVPILYALKTGMFLKAGLDVQLQRIGSGAAIGAAVASGSVDLGKSSSVSILQGFARGIPFRVLAPGAMYDDRVPNVQLLVAKDAPFRTASDLNGQTLATQTVAAIDQVAVDAWMDRNGGDAASLHWVEIPMTAGAAALEQHRAAGQIFTAPLLDDALANGKLRALAPVYSAIAPRFLFSAYFTTADWAAKNGGTIRTFAAVMRQAGAYTNAHHDEVAPIVAALADQTVPVMLKTQWAVAGTTLDVSDLQSLIDASAKYGLLAKSFPAGGLIAR